MTKEKNKKMMKINNREFKVKNAVFDAIISKNGKIGWSFEINTEKSYYDGVEWEPRLYGEWLEFEIPDLSKVDEFVLNVPDAYDYKKEEYFFALYVFEHEDVYESKIKIAKIEKNFFKLKWHGKCDVNYSNAFGLGLSLELDTQIEFKDIAIEKTHDDNEALRLFGKHFDPKGYYFKDSDYGIRFRLLGS